MAMTNPEIEFTVSLTGDQFAPGGDCCSAAIPSRPAIPSRNLY